jgi:hypothetical protein
MSVRGLRNNDPWLDHNRISFVGATLIGEYSYDVGSLTFIMPLVIWFTPFVILHQVVVCVSAKFKCFVYQVETFFGS